MTHLNLGTKLKDFVEAMESDSQVQSQIADLRHEVEGYAKQFPTIGFEIETMKYNKWRWCTELVSFGGSFWNNNVAENIRILVLEKFVNYIMNGQVQEKTDQWYDNKPSIGFIIFFQNWE